jgi:hypothetical protein
VLACVQAQQGMGTRGLGLGVWTLLVVVQLQNELLEACKSPPYVSECWVTDNP